MTRPMITPLQLLLITFIAAKVAAVAHDETFVHLDKEDGTKFAAWVPPSTGNRRKLKKRKGSRGEEKEVITTADKPEDSPVVMTVVNISPLAMDMVDRQVRDDTDLTVAQKTAFEDAVAVAKEYNEDPSGGVDGQDLDNHRNRRRIKSSKEGKSGKDSAKDGAKKEKKSKKSKGSLPANFARGKSFGEKDKVVTSLARFSTSTVVVPGGELLCIGDEEACIKTIISVDKDKGCFNPLDPARRFDPKNDKVSKFPGGLEHCQPDDVEKVFKLDASIKVSQEYRRLTGRHFTDIHPESFSRGAVPIPLWPITSDETDAVTLRANGHDSKDEFEIRLDMALASPRVFEVTPFLSESSLEAETLIGMMKQDNMRLTRGSSLIGDALLDRASMVLRAEPSFAEIAHHHEGSIPRSRGLGLVPRSEYERFATLFVVLGASANLVGGDVRLPHCDEDVHVLLSPSNGNGILVYNVLPDGNFDLSSLTDLTPVERGDVWIATFVVAMDAAMENTVES